jgi:hypothetical protein
MASPRWLAVPALVTLSAVVFSACSSVATPTSSATSSGASSSSASGSGGAGGSDATTATVTSAGGSTEDAGPLSCKLHTYSTIKSGPCDLLAQDCAEGKTCKELQYANGSWGTQCVTASGLKGEGEACKVDEECRAKLTCAAGRCAPVCCGATNEPCLGGICNLFIQLDNTGKVNKQVCHYAQACDLLTEKACDPGFACHVEDNKQGLATCVQPSGDQAGDLGPCHYLNDCADMEHCLGGTPTKAGKCHFYCDLDQANPASPGAALGGCPAGQVCTAAKVDNIPFTLGLANIGLCAPGP